MLEVNKNLKDTLSPLPNLPLTKGEEQGGGLSYTKTNKLVSALYMVTDIMDKEEPLRNKLRNLGTNIISDMHLIQQNHTGHTVSLIHERVAEVLSFLEIASSVGILSEMNCSILTKEFLELRKSIIENSSENSQNWLEEFMTSSEELDLYPTSPLLRGRSKEGVFPSTRRENSIGHSATRIGVQKGSTLLQALSRVEGQALSKVGVSRLGGQADRIRGEKMDVLKGKRREEIISIIKDKMKSSPDFAGVSIKDIALALRSLGEDRGEKTLQRELVSMVLDGVLVKTGSKRWSRYSMK